MAFTQADLTAVQTAIARGERSVTFADRTVTYRSIDELREAAAMIAQALEAADTTRRAKQSYAVGSKGL